MSLCDYLYYGLFYGSLSMTSYLLLEYATEPSTFIDRITYKTVGIGLWGVEKYVILNEYYTKYIKPLLNRVKEHKFIYLNKNTNTIHYMNDLDTLDASNLYYKKFVIDNMIVYKCFNDISQLDSENVTYNKAFVQLELEQNNNKFDLTNFIKPFCVVGNQFHKTLLGVILHNNYNVDITDNYQLNYMDTNINIGSVDDTSNIVLTEDGFDIIELNN